MSEEELKELNGQIHCLRCDLIAEEGQVKKWKWFADRFKTIAYNAITESQIEERLSHEDVLKELGITEEEYKEIMNA